MNVGRLDIIIVKRELEEKRKEFDRISVNMSLEEKLEWIRNFFNEYVPELEKRYMTEEELRNGCFYRMSLEFGFIITFLNMDLTWQSTQNSLCTIFIGKDIRDSKQWIEDFLAIMINKKSNLKVALFVI